MQLVDWSVAVQPAVGSGLEAAAVLDVDGKAVAVAGALDDDEARAIAAVVTRRLRAPDLLARMLAGELVTSSLDDREVSIGIAARCVFVVAVLGRDLAASQSVANDLRRMVERLIRDARAQFPELAPVPGSGSGGSSSGPAQLPVIELGVTVPRRDKN